MNTYIDNSNPLFNYILQRADNSLILSQRLAEWCGHGPVLEQDIALTNVALDILGQARLYYQYVAKLEGKGRSEDDLAYHRNEREYRNVLLVEQPNGNWGNTIVRQFLYDVYHYYLLNNLIESPDDQLKSIAEKSFKEVQYHLKFSSDWVIRLGDGTEESHEKIQDSVNHLLKYTHEFFMPTKSEVTLMENGVIPDLSKLEKQYDEYVHKILEEATIDIPDVPVFKSGGKNGSHTEHLGFILTELQYMQRSYPGLEW